MECFVALTKIDEEKRLIHGRAVQETPDRSNEILDYASAKDAFTAWSTECMAATNGLSKGNVRVMHGKTVAGKVVDLAFNDAEKAIDIVVKVVDDNEWRKCLEGVYQGFSVGGSYARKWQDGPYTRYTPKVSEVSLVDRPCIPTAKFFAIHKADGSVERHSFRMLAAAPPLLFADLYKRAPASSPAPLPRPLLFDDLHPPRDRHGALRKTDGRAGRDGDGDGVKNEGKHGNGRRGDGSGTAEPSSPPPNQGSVRPWEARWAASSTGLSATPLPTGRRRPSGRARSGNGPRPAG